MGVGGGSGTGTGTGPGTGTGVGTGAGLSTGAPTWMAPAVTVAVGDISRLGSDGSVGL
jgi:hypothetical protein